MKIDFAQVLFQAINFGIILFVLNKYLYKPVLGMLETRRKKINEGLAAADSNLKAQEEMEKEKKSEIAKARKEAQAIIKDAEKEAKVRGEEIILEARTKAKSEAELIIANAESDRSQALKGVEKEAGKLAIAMAKKALAENLTPKEIEAITTKLVSKLG